MRASWVAEELGSAYPVLLALKRALDPAGVMNPGALIAKSDGFQGLFPEQLRALVRAARETWELRRRLDREYQPSAVLERGYMARMQADRERLFRS